MKVGYICFVVVFTLFSHCFYYHNLLFSTTHMGYTDTQGLTDKRDVWTKLIVAADTLYICIICTNESTFVQFLQNSSKSDNIPYRLLYVLAFWPTQ